MRANKVIVITGASSGIGLQTANFLASKGYKIYGISRRDFESDKFVYYKGDVTNKKDMIAILEDIYNKEQRIDVLINNAGMGISGAVEYINDDDLNKIFDVNVKAVINMCSICLPYLRKSRGKIINISSVGAVIPLPFQSCYSATKSAIEVFSFALFNEVKSQGIQICCVRPGDTKTGFTSARIKTEIVNEVYGEKIKNSVEKMEKDETKGVAPIKVSKVIYKALKRKHMPLVKTVGLNYKFICFLQKILPLKFVNWIVGKIY